MRFVSNVLLALGFVVSLWLPSVAYAQGDVETGYQSILSQGIIFANICPAADEPCECRDSGKCQLSDMLQIFVNISIGILAISGSIALIMFFYGGLTWVLSAGNPKKIEQGKEIVTRAVIGLAIIFGAYALVNFVIAAVTGAPPGTNIEDTINATQGGGGAGGILETGE